jgi:hypothetical protein
VTTSSMGENRPEPIHLHAVQEGVNVKVMRGDEIIVQASNSLNFVADSIKELKLRGHSHETSVVIYGVSHNPAFNGAIKHHQG